MYIKQLINLIKKYAVQKKHKNIILEGKVGQYHIPIVII